jgi:hypothetical protein
MDEDPSDNNRKTENGRETGESRILGGLATVA